MLLAFITEGSLKEKSFVYTLEYASEQGLPVILLHDPSHSFPSVQEQPPNLRDNLFKKIAIRLSGYPTKSWEDVLSHIQQNHSIHVISNKKF